MKCGCKCEYEQTSNRVLDHLKLMKGRRANTCEKRGTIVRLTKDESMHERHSSRMRKEHFNNRADMDI